MASNVKAEPPTNSGKVVEFEMIQGHPKAIASKTGSPKPSFVEGKTNNLQLAYKRSKSSSFTGSGENNVFL